MRISKKLGSGVAGITGKEGTEDQWRKLYEAAGLKISKITSLQDNFGTSIVEGVKHRWPISGVPTFHSTVRGASAHGQCILAQ